MYHGKIDKQHKTRHSSVPLIRRYSSVTSLMPCQILQ